jgi:hypothetical protein
MKNIFLTSILLFSFFISFGQSIKKYSLITSEDESNTSRYFLQYNGIKIPIGSLLINENFFYFKGNNITYKIDTSKIELNSISFHVKEYSLNSALNSFSNQSQTALVLQLLAPSLLLLKSDVGIYSTLGVSFIAAIIHINSFRHLKKYSTFDKSKKNAIEYPY